MCLSNCFDHLTEEDYFKPAPNYCPCHPKFDKGNRSLSPLGFYRYTRRCEYCIVDRIKSIPEKYPEYNPDAHTIQLVLDVLAQCEDLVEYVP